MTPLYWALAGWLVLVNLIAFAGMRIFRHKTRHWYFVWGIPVIMAVQIALAVWLTAQK